MINKPLLVVVTGPPACGKSTLARVLSKEIKCPLISRDELKEGYLTTTRILQKPASKEVNLHIYETFFQIIELFISKGVSLIIEAAFQHKLWQPKLIAFLEPAAVRIIVCQTNPDLAKQRFAQRVISNLDREKFHGESSTNPMEENISLLIENFEHVHMQAPTLVVDTTENYNPSLENIITFIQHQNSR